MKRIYLIKNETKKEEKSIIMGGNRKRSNVGAGVTGKRGSRGSGSKKMKIFEQQPQDDHLSDNDVQISMPSTTFGAVSLVDTLGKSQSSELDGYNSDESVQEALKKLITVKMKKKRAQIIVQAKHIQKKLAEQSKIGKLKYLKESGNDNILLTTF